MHTISIRHVHICAQRVFFGKEGWSTRWLIWWGSDWETERQMAADNVQISRSLALRRQSNQILFKSLLSFSKQNQWMETLLSEIFVQVKALGTTGRCIAQTTNRLTLPAVISEQRLRSPPPSEWGCRSLIGSAHCPPPPFFQGPPSPSRAPVPVRHCSLH